MCGLTFVLVLAAAVSIFVAFSNGANDVANAFASAVGSKALKVKHALLIAAVLNLLGAVLLGSNVSKMLIGGIVHVRHFDDAGAYVTGMFACMVAAGCFIFIATHTGLPVSSTHAIVGGMMGIAVVMGGIEAINWKSFAVVALAWIFAPFMAAACSFCTIKLIRLTIYGRSRANTMARACTWIPLFSSIVVIAVAVAIIHGTKFWDKFSHWNKVLWALAVIVPLMYAAFRAATRQLAAKFANRGDFGIEHVFRRFQAGTSCLIGLAIGSNDVANSAAPVVAIYFVGKLGVVPDSFAEHAIPIWMLAMCGLGMSIGVLSLGHKVIGTLGKNITLLTNSRGFSVDFSTATTIILASVFGIPISSTHAATGSIIGVGLEKGLRGLNLRLLSKIFITWLMTVPLSAAFTICTYFVLRACTSLFF
ncbi:MAG: inorganic phosphate transporter [Puniceicoccales bacterium]|jgi:PiT family inorganic phosphate transporter|nr:inorganic phosphate transporter [Puniceicoccales bacterium]